MPKLTQADLPRGYALMATESVRSARRRKREDYEFEPGWVHVLDVKGNALLCRAFAGQPLWDVDESTARVSCPHCLRAARALAHTEKP